MPILSSFDEEQKTLKKQQQRVTGGQNTVMTKADLQFFFKRNTKQVYINTFY